MKGTPDPGDLAVDGSGPTPEGEGPETPGPDQILPDLELLRAGEEPSDGALRLRGCLSKGAIFVLLLTSASFAAISRWYPQGFLDTTEPLWLGRVDSLAFHAMLLGFAWVLWRPQGSRPALLIAKAGFCFQIALSTGGQSFIEPGPRLAAVAFMFVAIWHLLSRLGLGALRPNPADLPPP